MIRLGKLSRLKKLGPEDERTADPKGLAKIKGSIMESLENSFDANTARVRAKYIPHWMRVCGVDRPEDIDYSQPNVHLEWFLCDIRMLTRLQDGRREEVMALMDESQRETYLHGCDLDGRPYTDIEKSSLRKGIADALKGRHRDV